MYVTQKSVDVIADWYHVAFSPESESFPAKFVHASNNSMAKVKTITRSIRTMATSHGSSKYKNLPRVASGPLECPHEVGIPRTWRQSGLTQPGNKPVTLIILQQRLSVFRWRTQDVQTPRFTPPECPDTGRTGAESLPAIQQSEWWFG